MEMYNFSINILARLSASYYSAVHWVGYQSLFLSQLRIELELIWEIPGLTLYFVANLECTER